ncbi:hypothetical protein EDB85DRAFT_1892350 [Lactarius pseudohatsudake]|nr:hypothetical protein EDB85DRAFT_1892350 [Lactarius pseudohatsudake]
MTWKGKPVSCERREAIPSHGPLAPGQHYSQASVALWLCGIEHDGGDCVDLASTALEISSSCPSFPLPACEQHTGMGKGSSTQRHGLAAGSWVTSVGGTTNLPEVTLAASFTGFSNYFERRSHQTQTVSTFLCILYLVVPSSRTVR